MEIKPAGLLSKGKEHVCKHVSTIKSTVKERKATFTSSQLGQLTLLEQQEKKIGFEEEPVYCI